MGKGVSRGQPRQPRQPSGCNLNRTLCMMSGAAMEADAPVVLAAPVAAASARMRAKLYLPTAFVGEHMPAGLGLMQTVPRLRHGDETMSEAEALELYVAAIRETARVFATCNHKQTTMTEYDSYVVWIASWAKLSGFGEFVIVNHEVT